MAARPHVQLSDLPVELDHHVIHENASGYLLVHTKLTETCLNAIDSLAASTVGSHILVSIGSLHSRFMIGLLVLFNSSFCVRVLAIQEYSLPLTLMKGYDTVTLNKRNGAVLRASCYRHFVL